MNEFNALERRAGLLTMQGMQQATIHTGMFMQALAAHQAGNDKYLANTVLFATVLFFASASSRFEQRRVRVVAFAFAVTVFLFAVVRTAMLPL